MQPNSNKLKSILNLVLLICLKTENLSIAGVDRAADPAGAGAPDQAQAGHPRHCQGVHEAPQTQLLDCHHSCLSSIM